MEENAPKQPAAVEPPLARLIAQHPFAAGMRPEHVTVLAENGMRVRYEPGEVIFREGDPANRFYLIESGCVELGTRQAEDEALDIQELKGGEVLGWSWLFPPYRWHFEARAVEPTSAIFFYGSRIREACEEKSELGYELMMRISGVLIQRLQQTRDRLIECRKRGGKCQ